MSIIVDYLKKTEQDTPPAQRSVAVPPSLLRTKRGTGKGGLVLRLVFLGSAAVLCCLIYLALISRVNGAAGEKALAPVSRPLSKAVGVKTETVRAETEAARVETEAPGVKTGAVTTGGTLRGATFPATKSNRKSEKVLTAAPEEQNTGAPDFPAAPHSEPLGRTDSRRDERVSPKSPSEEAVSPAEEVAQNKLDGIPSFTFGSHAPPLKESGLSGPAETTSPPIPNSAENFRTKTASRPVPTETARATGPLPAKAKSAPPESTAPTSRHASNSKTPASAALSTADSSSASMPPDKNARTTPDIKGDLKERVVVSLPNAAHGVEEIGSGQIVVKTAAMVPVPVKAESRVFPSSLRSDPSLPHEKAPRSQTGEKRELVETASHYYQLGLLSQRRGNLGEAVSFYRRVLKLDPAYLPALTNLAATQIRQDRLRDAAITVAKTLALAPHNTKALINSGIIHLKEGRYDKAGNFFNRVLEKEPDSEAALVNLAYLARKKGDTQLLENFYRKITRSHPGNTDALFSYASMLEDQQRWAEAISLYKQGLDLKKISDDKQLNRRVKNRIGILETYSKP